jgi:bifunctional DNase/RNase
MDVEMKIRGLMMDPVTNMPIVVLKDVNGDAVLPIWVGIPEAHAIQWEIEKMTPLRPMTHDLLKNAFAGLNAQIRKVVVNELRDETFYAVIWLEQDGQVMCMDARPSDAIALALRADCPVYVSEQVLRTSRIAATGAENLTPEELRRWLENLNDEDLGRYKM